GSKRVFIQSLKSMLGVPSMDQLGKSIPPFGGPDKRITSRLVGSHGNSRTNTSLTDDSVNMSDIPFEHLPQHAPIHGQNHKKAIQSLRVMKFGGTSVGDADCIEKVVEIVRSSFR